MTVRSLLRAAGRDWKIMLMRVVVYGAGLFGIFLLTRMITDSYVAQTAIGGLAAAALIGGELVLTARLRGTTVEQAVVARTLALDFMISGPGKAMLTEKRRQQGLDGDGEPQPLAQLQRGDEEADGVFEPMDSDRR